MEAVAGARLDLERERDAGEGTIKRRPSKRKPGTGFCWALPGADRVHGLHSVFSTHRSAAIGTAASRSSPLMAMPLAKHLALDVAQHNPVWAGLPVTRYLVRQLAEVGRYDL